MLALLLACAAPPPSPPAGEPSSTTAPGDTGSTDTGPSDTAPAGRDSAPRHDSPADSPAADSADTAPPPGPLVFEGPPPSNLIFVSIDTLRRASIGHYGGGADSPFLDGLLAESVALQDHRSCSNWTYNSMICALTGQYATEAGVVPEVVSTATPLGEDAGTLGRWLKEAGFITALANSNHFLTEELGWGPGYDLLVTHEDEPAEVLTAAGLALADELAAAAEPGQRWYLHVHYIDPHAEWAPPEAYLEGYDALAPIPWDLGDSASMQDIRDSWSSLDEHTQALVLEHVAFVYAAEVRYVDDQIRALFEGLTARGMLDDALVVLLSDHGEQFYEHGYLGHARGLHDEESAAIAGLWMPGRLAPSRFQGPTSHIDVAPTALHLLGVEADRPLMGLPVGEASPRRMRFGQMVRLSNTLQSIEQSGRRLIYTWEGELSYYDLASDPGEQDDLFVQGDPEIRALWRRLRPRVERLDLLYLEVSPTWPSL